LDFKRAKKRWLLYSVTGFVFLLVLLAATAPAAWLAWGVARVSDNRVLLDAPRGSVWQGQATLILQGRHIPPRSLGGLSWRINPFWLVAGRLPVFLRGTDPQRRLQANIDLHLEKVFLRDVDVQFPADVIPALYPPALFFNLGGELRLTAPALELKRGAVTGQAELYWQAATTSLVKVNPLGDYRLYLSGGGARATLKLETPRGALLLVGDGQWDPAGGRLDFNGLARPLAYAADLEPLLQVLGRDQGGGQRSLVVNTRVR
jgi:general secretion pathway protein N